jgi:hypothetical protein
MATAGCRITVTAGSIDAASLFAVAGIEVVTAGNISGAIENGASIGRGSRALRKIGAQILPFVRAAMIGDAGISRRSVP